MERRALIRGAGHIVLWRASPARAVAVAGLLCAVGALPGCGRPGPRGQGVPPGATVLALGDSLTHGTGAPPGQGWPERLAERSGWRVINAGVPGDTSARALARLPELLQQHTPALVILGIGGNDFLRGLPVEQTRQNLRQAVEQARAAGAQVLLVGVPRPTLAAAVTRTLDDHPLYAELAHELQLPLHAQGWSAVLSDPALRADRIHANAQGYRQFADGLRRSLVASGLLVD